MESQEGSVTNPPVQYAHMVEIGNLEHETKLDQVHQAEVILILEQ